MHIIKMLPQPSHSLCDAWIAEEWSNRLQVSERDSKQNHIICVWKLLTSQSELFRNLRYTLLLLGIGALQTALAFVL